MTTLSDIGIASESIDILLDYASINGPYEVKAIPGGRNNRVFELSTGDGTWLLKEYFHHPTDPRDRLGQECSFINYAWESGVRSLPRLFSSYPIKHLSLLEFIKGSRITLEQVALDHIRQAVAFFSDVNRGKMSEAATGLAAASEACFSLSSHLNSTRMRVDRLTQMEKALTIDFEAQKFVEDELIPFWQDLVRKIESKTTLDERETLLSRQERCLSPSDFGYHNALQEPSGFIRFVDFEYAGWDDPAKLICDFANQPDMILDNGLSSVFTRALIDEDYQPESLARRVMFVMPVYQLKWSCIILNDFLPFGRSRRSFTDDRAAEEERKSLQLAKSRNMLARARQSAAEIK